MRIPVCIVRHAVKSHSVKGPTAWHVAMVGLPGLPVRVEPALTTRTGKAFGRCQSIDIPGAL